MRLQTKRIIAVTFFSFSLIVLLAAAFGICFATPFGSSNWLVSETPIITDSRPDLTLEDARQRYPFVKFPDQVSQIRYRTVVYGFGAGCDFISFDSDLESCISSAVETRNGINRGGLPGFRAPPKLTDCFTRIDQSTKLESESVAPSWFDTDSISDGWVTQSNGVSQLSIWIDLDRNRVFIFFI